MGSFDYLESLKDEDEVLFKKCIRKLLDGTFILHAKDERMYDYVVRETNHKNINKYLNIIGYNLVVEDNLKVAMLTQVCNEDETVGIKRSNLLRFTCEQLQLLLVLWQIYLEKVGFYEYISASMGEIVDKLKSYGINMKTDTKKGVFKEALKVMKKYSLIDYDENNMDENARVRLYPSLQFCMNIGQFKEVVKEFIPENNEETKEIDYIEEE